MKQLNFSARGAETRLLAFARTAEPSPKIVEIVRKIRDRVRDWGIAEVLKLSAEIEGVTLTPKILRVQPGEFDTAAKQVSAADKRAMRASHKAVREFHRPTTPKGWTQRNLHGAVVGEAYHPIRRVGLYIPGGRAPLVSTVIMTATLAKLAGVTEIVVCTPPLPDGTVHPAILTALRLCGVEEVYRIGGAIAISAMTYGAGNLTPVDKIFGPGNAYVNEAKRQVFGEVGIDLLAGPSEVMILTDEKTPAAYVAADLLAQAEHGTGAKVVYTSLSDRFCKAVDAELAAQQEALGWSKQEQKLHAESMLAVRVASHEDAVRAANLLAPEHLEILLPPAQARAMEKQITTAGAIFSGLHTPTAVGDFAAGPNHTLPTARTARFLSGLRLTDFYRRTSLTRYDARSLGKARPTVEAFSRMEQLPAHGRSATIRFPE